MTYSCAVFDRPDEPLADAQRRKYRRICEQLRLGAGQTACSRSAAAGAASPSSPPREFGCTRHGADDLGASRRRWRASARGAGLDASRSCEEDYRRHEGSYTKVASIEMLEAIGEDQFGTYFEAIDRLLAPGGVACVQTILIPDERWERYRRSPDWIERYVFPGCLIPSLTRADAGDDRQARG